MCTRPFLFINFQVLCLSVLSAQDLPTRQPEPADRSWSQWTQSPMKAPIDLVAPRIKGDGVTVWYGRIAYRNCHVHKAKAGGRIVILSTSRGLFEVEWMKIPSEARAKLFHEYSTADGVNQEILVQ
jgi:hypothetical protein